MRRVWGDRSGNPGTARDRARKARYALRAVKQRLYQALFREAVTSPLTTVDASCCASLSRCYWTPHIVSDKDEGLGQSAQAARLSYGRYGLSRPRCGKKVIRAHHWSAEEFFHDACNAMRSNSAGSSLCRLNLHQNPDETLHVRRLENGLERPGGRLRPAPGRLASSGWH